MTRMERQQGEGKTYYIDDARGATAEELALLATC